MTRRVAITGAGILCSLGRGAAVIEAARSGQVGISAIRAFDASSHLCRIAAQVPEGDVPPGSSDRFTRLAVAAAEDAVAFSGLEDLEHAGVIIGTGLGGGETEDAAYRRLYRDGATRLPPLSIPNAMYNAATSAVSARFGARGPSFAVVSACASGTHSIGQGSWWIRQGVADVVLAGASDAPITASLVRAWEGLRVLSNDNDRPERACRPFSVDRGGLVLGEGAAVVVLEEMDRATARGASILGEIEGFGLSSDAGHPTDPSAEGAMRAMRMALSEANARPEDIDAVNAHGTATRANDAMETEALREVLGERAARIPVSATKSMHGHAMGASGAIEVVLSLLAANQGFVPPTMSHTPGDPACDLDYVPNASRGAVVRRFLSNSFGFGGMNAVLVVRTAV